MKRLDEIKERLSQVKRNPYEMFANEGMEGMEKRVREFKDNAPGDISYLLSLTQRYKEALQQVADSYGSEGTDIQVARKMVKFAKEALEK